MLRTSGVWICGVAAALACKGSESAKSSAARDLRGSAQRAAAEVQRLQRAPAGKEMIAGQAQSPAVTKLAAARGPVNQVEQAGRVNTAAGQPESAAESAPAALDAMAVLFPKRHIRSADVTDKAQRRIRYQLREVARAPIALRDLIRVPRPDGGMEVYAIYEYSVYEDCVKSARSRQEGRDKCLEAPVSVVIGENPDHDEAESGSQRYLYKDVRLGRECRKYGVVHATFSQAPAGQDPGEAGALRVLSLPLPEIDCELKTLAQYFVDDVDGDRRAELYLEVTSERPSVTQQRGSYADNYDVQTVTLQRNVLVIKTTGEALEVQGKISGPDVTLRELNRDGHLDLVIIGECLMNLAEGVEFATEVECRTEMRERIWYLYDREVDRWVLHGEPLLGEGTGDAEERTP